MNGGAFELNTQINARRSWDILAESHYLSRLSRKPILKRFLLRISLAEASIEGVSVVDKVKSFGSGELKLKMWAASSED